MSTLPSALPSVPAFTTETTLGAFVVARPGLTRVFEKLGLDYCCGGRRTLAAACAARGLAADTVLVMLETLAAGAAAGPADIDAAALSLTDLADHIERTHHHYVKEELPRLLEMADRVVRKHGERDPRLPEVAATVAALTAEMLSHMQKEEGILFPLVRQLEAGGRAAFPGGAILHPIRVMEAEHASAGQAVARLRELTDGFTPDAEACHTHCALLAGLEEFEGDLHRHVHKENNILFPRALALAGAA